MCHLVEGLRTRGGNAELASMFAKPPCLRSAHAGLSESLTPKACVRCVFVGVRRRLWADRLHLSTESKSKYPRPRPRPPPHRPPRGRSSCPRWAWG
eukprot:10642180-Alexandrium_andersonii.AAC.1